MTMRRRFAFLALYAMGVGCCDGGSAPDSQPDSTALERGVTECFSAAQCERRCRLGVGVNCVEAGRLYEYGRAGPSDPPRAFELYQRACTLNEMSGCFSMALLLELGSGTPRDWRRARELYRKVCYAGSRVACHRAVALSPLREAPSQGPLANETF
jgi:uncharacterized protein